MEELREKKIPFDEKIEVGLMIEIPSAALVVDYLAQEADFMSIGTNDLIQYTLAVDRVNDEVSHLYEPLHPAILRLIHQTVQAAHAAGKWVGMCGEMAGDPDVTPILIGLELDELSVSPALVPKTQKEHPRFALRRLPRVDPGRHERPLPRQRAKAPAPFPQPLSPSWTSNASATFRSSRTSTTAKARSPTACWKKRARCPAGKCAPRSWTAWSWSGSAASPSRPRPCA
jgi:hypothetical protein